MSPETPHPPLVSGSLTGVVVVDEVSVLVDGEVCQMHELVLEVTRLGGIRLRGEPETFNKGMMNNARPCVLRIV